MSRDERTADCDSYTPRTIEIRQQQDRFDATFQDVVRFQIADFHNEEQDGCLPTVWEDRS